MDGILRCSRYSFGPNRLHYCGPDANREMFSYLRAGVSDPGLEMMLRGFRTLYPYLQLIARANGIKDPFDERVVEAYWIGNGLLEHIGKRAIHRHLLEEQELKRRLGLASFDAVAEKIGLGAVPHHSFHVLNIWKRTGHLDIAHDLQSMDACRVSWGEVTAVDGPAITILSKPLIETRGTLALGEPSRRTVRRDLAAPADMEQIAPGQIVTVHWGVPCEVISPGQAAALETYTVRSLALANAGVRTT